MGKDIRKAYIGEFSFDYNNRTFIVTNVGWDRATIRTGKLKTKTFNLENYDDVYNVARNQHILRVILNVYNKDIDLDAVFK